MSDDEATQIHPQGVQLEPVRHVRDLPPSGAAEGTVCYVRGENAFYVFEGGFWKNRDEDDFESFGPDEDDDEDDD